MGSLDNGYSVHERAALAGFEDKKRCTVLKVRLAYGILHVLRLLRSDYIALRLLGLLS